MSDEINRRDFMKRAAFATAGAGLAVPGVGATRVVGANEKIRVGVIGTGREGRTVMAAFLKQPDVEVVAVCDVYRPNLDKGLSDTGAKARDYKDFREVLDRKDIDAVVIATPDHWHALLTVLACQAGKDVYVEKPIANSIEEGKRMVEAARKYNRVVQVGTEWRSNTYFQKGVQVVQNGLIGKVSYVRSWNYINLYPEGVGNPPNADPPEGLDWDLWLGPARKVAYNWNRFGVGDRWSTFRYFWDYAGGWMTDWGVHYINVVQWAMKVDGPSAVVASGGKWYLQDNSETPDTLQATFEYSGFVATYENRLCNQGVDRDGWWGMEFYGTDGSLVLGDAGVQVYRDKRGHWSELGQTQVDRTPTMEMKGFEEDYAAHVRNFLDCVKSRQRPVSDIEIGHRATTTCHLGNIAYRTKTRLVWDVAKEKLLQGGAEAQKLLGVEYRAPWKLEV